MTAVESNPAVLRRRVRPWQQRSVAFFDMKHRQDGCSWLLDQAVRHDFRQVYLGGGWSAATTPEREWWYAPVAAEGWEVVKYSSDPRGATYRRGQRTVDVRLTGAWYGDAPATQAAAAHVWLERMVRSHFDRGATIMGTPARTGQDLLERSLPTYEELGRERAYEYPAIPADVADIIRHNIGQGRMEFPNLPDTPRTSDRLYLLDARWMYASCIRNLPVGPVTHDDGIDFEPYRNGFYRVLFRVPEDWRHIGLLPMWDAFDQRTIWPVRGKWVSFASEPEVRLAIENGWDVKVIERILFAPSSQPGSDPARAWIEKLVKMRSALDTPVGGSVPQELRPLLSRAVRRLVIDPIGGWNRTGQRQQRVTPHAHKDTIPADAWGPGKDEPNPRPIYPTKKNGDPDLSKDPLRWEWSHEEPLSPMQLAYMRPEWCAMVWGRARAKTNAAALRVPPHELGPIRSDAFAITRYDPAEWPDNGRVGTFRLKREWHWETPRTVPASRDAWLALLAEDGKADDDDE